MQIAGIATCAILLLYVGNANQAAEDHDIITTTRSPALPKYPPYIVRHQIVIQCAFRCRNFLKPVHPTSPFFWALSIFLHLWRTLYSLPYLKTEIYLSPKTS